MSNGTSVDYPGAKIVTVLAAAGIGTWSDLAAALAALYTLLLIIEWLWKRLLRPFAERRGWILRPQRRHSDKLDMPNTGD